MKVSVFRNINSAHQLPRTQLHGHTYRITAMTEGMANDTGFACTFASLQGALEPICSALDHCRLETFIGSPATAERLAVHIARAVSKAMDRVINVRVDVGNDGAVETNMFIRDGEYFSA